MCPNQVEVSLASNSFCWYDLEISVTDSDRWKHDLFTSKLYKVISYGKTVVKGPFMADFYKNVVSFWTVHHLTCIKVCDKLYLFDIFVITR